MKTPAEIIKGIECCHLQPISNCSACPYGKTDLRGVCAILLAQDACEVMRNQSEQITRSQKNLNNLEYKLEGVMHSVDKWLDGAELEQDEVNRAVTMREKTLQIIEAKDAENEKLRAELDERKLIITKRKDAPGMLDVLEIEPLAHIIAEKRGGACAKDCLACVFSESCIYRDIAEICINEGYLPAATVRAEAIEEFAERLKLCPIAPNVPRTISEYIDIIAKGMREGPGDE